MTTTIDPSTAPADAAARAFPCSRVWPWGLGGVALVALFLTGWQIWVGAPSTYYASIALSMSRSWSNFLFGAVDPAGTVTLDKIPGSYWIPALFVRVFGYSAWTVILPNALAAVGAALVTAVAGRRLAGVRAGLFAGAIVALTPILVAVSRSNEPESFFVLGLALTAWASVRAVQARSRGWLLAAGASIGLAFQFYELEAWAVWPALAAAYLCTRQTWGRRIGHLLLAGAVSIGASLWWVALVSLIPADARPYIGSTITNNPSEMVFGYNGLGRFSATADSTAYESFTPPFSGDPGVLRLFNAQVAGQIAWLIPAAIVALIVMWALRFSRPLTVLLTVWLGVFAVMFSAVAGMHQFYTAALAVPLALSVGTALAVAHRADRVWPQVAIVATAGVTAVGIGIAAGGYSLPVVLLQAIAAAVAIVLLLSARRTRAVTAAVVAVALLLAPGVWSAVTIAHPSSVNPVAGGVSEVSGGFGSMGGRGGPGGSGGGTFGQGATPGSGRAGGPATRGGPDGGAGPQGSPLGFAAGGGAGARAAEDTAQVIDWLTDHDPGRTYLAATFGAQSAAQLILDSDGGSFLPIGGFSGSDAVPTLDRFIALVRSGEVRYVLDEGVSTDGRGNDSARTPTASAQIRTWVSANCTPASGAPTTVYDCG